MTSEVHELLTGPSYEERQKYEVRVIPHPDIEAILKEESEKLRSDFIRNMKLFLYRDGQILLKVATHSLDSLSPYEFDYLKRIRGLYTANELVNIDRALAPEYANIDGTHVTATLTVTVDKQEVESEAARQAASRKLLDQFTVGAQISITTKEPVEPPVDLDTIEADFREVPS